MKKFLNITLLIFSYYININAAPLRTFNITLDGTTTIFTLPSIIGSGINLHKIVWTLNGTNSACTIKLQGSADNITFSDIITGTCTSSNVSSTTSGVYAFYRLNLSAFTASSAGANINIMYAGYLDIAAGIGGAGTGTSGQVAFFDSCCTITGDTDLTFSVDTLTMTKGIGITNLMTPVLFGGSTATSTLTLKSTSGVGTTDSISLAGGNNGATTFLFASSSGIGIGTTNPSTFKLQFVGNIGPDADNTYNIGDSTHRIQNLNVANIIYLGQQNAASGQLYIQSNSSAQEFFEQNSTDSTSAQFIFRKSRGTASARTDVVNGDITFYIEGDAYSNTMFDGATIQGAVDGTFTSGQAPPSRLQFLTNVANGGQIERMRIDNAGNVGIGTTSPTSFILQVAGNIGPNTDNSNNLGSSTLRYRSSYIGTSIIDSGSLVVNGTSIPTGYTFSVDAGTSRLNARVYMANLTTSAALQQAVLCQATTGEIIADSVACLASSAKFKHNIKNIDLGLKDVLSLRPVNFYYNYEKQFDNYNHNMEQFGFIAEEAEKVDFRLVGYDNEGNVRTFRYENYTAVLTKAIQELNQKIEVLNAKIN